MSMRRVHGPSDDGTRAPEAALITRGVRPSKRMRRARAGALRYVRTYRYHRYGRWPSPRSLALTLQPAGFASGRRRRGAGQAEEAEAAAPSARACGADRGALARARPRVPRAPRNPGRRPGGEIRRAGTPNAIEGVQIDPKPHAGFSPFKHVKKHYIENPMRVVKTTNIEVHACVRACVRARHRRRADSLEFQYPSFL